MKNNGKTSKLTVASELLDNALRLYFEEHAYFSSLHLAGAADEILGAYVTHHGDVSAFKSILNTAVRLSKYIDKNGIKSSSVEIKNLMNYPKNSVKHMNSLSDDSVSFDAKFEAESMLDRAISNYYLLMAHSVLSLKSTDLIDRFNARLIA